MSTNTAIAVATIGAGVLLFGLTAAGYALAGVILTVLWTAAWVYRFWELR